MSDTRLEKRTAVTEFLLIPLEDLAVFPNMTVTLPVDGRTRTAEREYRAVVEEILELRGADSRVGAFLRAIAEPGPLADTIGYAPDVSFQNKLEVLETLDVTERLELAVRRSPRRRAAQRTAGSRRASPGAGPLSPTRRTS